MSLSSSEETSFSSEFVNGGAIKPLFGLQDLIMGVIGRDLVEVMSLSSSCVGGSGTALPNE